MNRFTVKGLWFSGFLTAGALILMLGAQQLQSPQTTYPRYTVVSFNNGFGMIGLTDNATNTLYVYACENAADGEEPKFHPYGKLDLSAAGKARLVLQRVDSGK